MFHSIYKLIISFVIAVSIFLTTIPLTAGTSISRNLNLIPSCTVRSGYGSMNYQSNNCNTYCGNVRIQATEPQLQPNGKYVTTVNVHGLTANNNYYQDRKTDGIYLNDLIDTYPALAVFTNNQINYSGSKSVTLKRMFSSTCPLYTFSFFNEDLPKIGNYNLELFTPYPDSYLLGRDYIYAKKTINNNNDYNYTVLTPITYPAPVVQPLPTVDYPYLTYPSQPVYGQNEVYNSYLRELRRLYPNGLRLDFKCGNINSLSLTTARGGRDVCNNADNSDNAMMMTYVLNQYASDYGTLIGSAPYMDNLRKIDALNTVNNNISNCNFGIRHCRKPRTSNSILNFHRIPTK